MTYIQEFEAEFQKKLEGAGDAASIVRWISEKVLESYRNGITAGQKGANVIRQGESRDFKGSGDIAEALGRSFERLEEQIDAAESRIHCRLASRGQD